VSDGTTYYVIKNDVENQENQIGKGAFTQMKVFDLE
jgi:hypothetical protein